MDKQKHAKLIGRIIFANFLDYPLEKYKRFIEEAESSSLFEKLKIKEKLLSRARVSVPIVASGRSDAGSVRGLLSNGVVAVVAKQGKGFSIRYTYQDFNKVYLVRVGFIRPGAHVEVRFIEPTATGRMNVAPLRTQEESSSAMRLQHKLRRISSRNELTHRILKGVIQHQSKYLRTGDPADLMPFSQIELAKWINESSHPETRYGIPDRRPYPLAHGKRDKRCDVRYTKSGICNTWVSRLVNRLSVITPSGEEKTLKSFFQTQKDINKRLIKQLLDNENEDIESGRLKSPLTDNQIRAKLERGYGISLSRWSVGHCRKDMGIPPAKRRLSGYKYPPLSANFSMLYPLVLEEVLKSTPSSPGIYEFRVKSKEIEYPNGKTPVIYIGSTMNIKKRLREHLGKNSKNGHIRDFLKKSGCSFRYILFKKDWQKEERGLYRLFMDTYGSALKCNRVRPRVKR